MIGIPQEARTGAQAAISEKARGLQARESVHPAEPAIESLEHSLPFILPTRFHAYLPWQPLSSWKASIILHASILK